MLREECDVLFSVFRQQDGVGCEAIKVRKDRAKAISLIGLKRIKRSGGVFKQVLGGLRQAVVDKRILQEGCKRAVKINGFEGLVLSQAKLICLMPGKQSSKPR